MTTVFIIALDPMESQFTEAQQVFEGYSIKIHRAFDGRGRQPHHSSNLVKSPLWRGPLNGGEYGCARSHNEIWAKIQMEGVDSAIVLEEDWLTTYSFDLKTLRALVEFVGDEEHPTLVYLGFHYSGIRPFKFIVRAYWTLLTHVKSIIRSDGFWTRPMNYNIQHRGRNRIVKGLKAGTLNLYTTGLPSGTYGYLLNKQAAAKLLELNAKCPYRSDEALNLAEMLGQVTMFKPEHPLISWDKSRPSTVQQVQSS